MLLYNKRTISKFQNGGELTPYEKEIYKQFDRIKRMQGDQGILNPEDSTVAYIGGYYNDQRKNMYLDKASMDQMKYSGYQSSDDLLKQKEALRLMHNTADKLQEANQGKDGYYTFNDVMYKKENGNWMKKINNKFVPLTEGNVKQRNAVLNTQAKFFSTLK